MSFLLNEVGEERFLKVCSRLLEVRGRDGLWSCGLTSMEKSLSIEVLLLSRERDSLTLILGWSSVGPLLRSLLEL